MKYRHTPVLVNEIMGRIPFRKDITVLDCNLGEGGHSLKIAGEMRKHGGGRLIGIERDKQIFLRAKRNLADFSDIVTLVNDNFTNLSEVLNRISVEAVDVILFDLGISSYHYFDDDRGFSFMTDQPLDMRLDETCSISANEILNTFEERKIAEILNVYGEERFGRNIARSVVKSRKIKPFETTFELVETVKSSVPRKFWPKNISPATKTFQALRIYVNSELDNLRGVLPVAVEKLRKGGQLIVISFHSLEDRIVKQFMNEMGKDCICPPQVPVCVCDNHAILKVITRRAIVPTDEELENNKASRSAKMRIAEKIR